MNRLDSVEQEDAVTINIVDCDGNIVEVHNITTPFQKTKRQKKQYLDRALLDEFAETIHSTNIFCKTEKLKEKYNLICVVIDRLNTAIEYLNKHQRAPVREQDFICFLVYANICATFLRKQQKMKEKVTV